MSAAWSLAGAYAIRAVDLVGDSAVIPVIPAGLEPATYALGKRRSVQLSYGTWTAENLPEGPAVRKSATLRQ